MTQTSKHPTYKCMKLTSRPGYSVWHGQRTRCYNKRDKLYKYYGARGIRVKYTSKEFVKWYAENLIGFIGDPSVDRIDNDGHYEISNIQLITRSENSKKRVRDKGPGKPRKKILISDAKSKDGLMFAMGSLYASRLTEVPAQNIREICGGNRRKTAKGYTFKYV